MPGADPSPSGPPPRVLCWGELLWDLFPDGPRLGGAAANTAYHAAVLGARAQLVSRVGQDELGRRAIARLQEAGVGVELLQVDPERATGTVEVRLDGGEPAYRIVEHAAWDRVEYSPSAAEAVQHAHALVYGTLAQRTPLGYGALHKALAAAAASCICICDLNVRPPFVTRETIQASLALANVVKLNAAEAASLSELYATADPVAFLLEQGEIELVVLTRGARGCLLARAGQRHEHPGFALANPAAGDRVGAGDAFAAVLAVELVRGTDLGAIAARANRYASYVAGQRGAMPTVPPALLRELGD